MKLTKKQTNFLHAALRKLGVAHLFAFGRTRQMRREAALRGWENRRQKQLGLPLNFDDQK